MGNTLADPAAFLLRIGDTDTREVVVAPSANGSIAELINDVQASVDSAGITGLVTVGENAGRITLSLPRRWTSAPWISATRCRWQRAVS